MPRPMNPDRFARVEVHPDRYADLELVRRQSGARSSSGAIAAVVQWVASNPDAAAGFRQWADANNIGRR